MVVQGADSGEQAKNAAEGDVELCELVEDCSQGEQGVMNDNSNVGTRPANVCMTEWMNANVIVVVNLSACSTFSSLCWHPQQVVDWHLQRPRPMPSWYAPMYIPFIQYPPYPPRFPTPYKEEP